MSEHDRVIRLERPAVQYGLRGLFIATAACSVGIAILLYLVRNRPVGPPPAWRYDGQLHQAIVDADQIVVRYGVMQRGDRLQSKKVLFTVTDPAEIADVRRHLDFTRGQDGQTCACPGILRIDWYKNNQLLADTSVIHGKSLRWEQWEGDADLTAKSKKWLVDWFGKYGLPESTVQKPPYPKTKTAPPTLPAS